MDLGISLCLVAFSLGTAGLIVERERSRRLSEGAVLTLLQESVQPWCFLPLEEESFPLGSRQFSDGGLCSKTFQSFLGEESPSWRVLMDTFQQSSSSPFLTAVQCVLQYGSPVVCSLTLSNRPYTLHLSLLKESTTPFPFLTLCKLPFHQGLLLTLVEASSTARTQAECAQATQQVRACLAVLNALPFPVWTRDHSGHLTFCNKAYAKELETQQHQVLSHQWELIDGPDAHSAQGLFRKALKNEAPQCLRVHKKAKGVAKTFDLTEAPLPLLPGCSTKEQRNAPLPPPFDPTLAVVGSAVDLSLPLTELKAAQDSLSLYRAVLDKFDTPFCILDAKEHVVAWSKSAFPFCNETRPPTVTVLGDILEFLRERNQLPDYIDFSTLRQIGHDWCTHRNVPYHDVWYLPSGRALDLNVRACQDKTIIIARDVSQALDLERNYRVLRAVWDVSVEQTPDALLILGKDHRIQKCSQALESLLNLTRSDWIGRSIKDFLGALAQRENLQGWEKTIENAIELRKSHKMPVLMGGRLMTCVYMPLPDGSHRLSIFPKEKKEEIGNVLTEL